MREIVLDTETTGLDPAEDRIVEIGAIELVNLLPTGQSYHQYINPGRPVPKEAENIHGLSDLFLRDKPAFADIAPAFLAFLGDDPLVIHNAAFDLAMLNAELDRLGQPQLEMSRATDTLAIARKRFPGAQASLDALCRRFSVDNSNRQKHGALLDSELLAGVYLELRGGRQQGLGLDTASPVSATPESRIGPATGPRAAARPNPLAPRITEQERAAHEAFIAEMGELALWKKA